MPPPAAGDGRLTPLRIFLATPSDVPDERRRLRAIVDELNAHNGLAEQQGFTLRVLGWEDATGGMGRAQGVILDQMPAAQWDVFVGALWTRFGSPSGGHDATGRPFDSGTEEEFRAAYDSWQATERPHILFYRRTSPVSPDALDLDQYRRVKAFFAAFGPEGKHPGLFAEYKTPKAFESRARQDLIKLLLRLAAERRPPPPPDLPTIVTSPSDDRRRPEEEHALLLYQLINESFSRGELEDLSFRMGIDYDNLSGDTKLDKARSLVQYCRNRGRLEELTRRFQVERPHLAGRLEG